MNIIDNVSITASSIEEQFDKNHLVLVSADSEEQPIKTWKCKVVNDAARKSIIEGGHLEDIDGRVFAFKTSHRPAASFLNFHFLISLLLNKRDRVEGCDLYLQSLPTERSFNTPGRWMRNSMLLVLAKMAGDVDPEGLAFCFGEPNVSTFVAETKIEGLQEKEVARLCMKTKGGGEGDEERDWDEDKDDDEEDDE